MMFFGVKEEAFPAETVTIKYEIIWLLLIVQYWKQILVDLQVDVVV